jgi:hypothetical protein
MSNEKIEQKTIDGSEYKKPEPMSEDAPLKCPKCEGFTQYFKNDYMCRDCGYVIATYNPKEKTWSYFYDVECYLCNETKPKNNTHSITVLWSETEYERIICKTCDEDGTIYESYEYCQDCGFWVPKDETHFNQEECEVKCIKCYFAEKGFIVTRKYHKTDAWRGHMETVLEGDNQAVAWHYCIIPHEQNKVFIETLNNWLKAYGYEYLNHEDRTSNLFSVNHQILVRKEKALTENDKRQLKEFDEIADKYYGRCFSIMSGSTFPIDIHTMQEELNEIK